MVYDSNIHHRKSIRLKDYDYSQNGAYFITICTQNKELYFEQYPKLKEIVFEQWNKLIERYKNISLDEFVIMPNHIHGIIFIDNQKYQEEGNRKGLPLQQTITNNIITIQNNNVGAGLAPALSGFNDSKNNTDDFKIFISNIIGTFKSICVVEWLKYIKQNNFDIIGKFWQRNYYERIIRNEIELNAIREYIKNNPLNWENDKLNNDGVKQIQKEGNRKGLPLQQTTIKNNIITQNNDDVGAGLAPALSGFNDI